MKLEAPHSELLTNEEELEEILAEMKKKRKEEPDVLKMPPLLKEKDNMTT